MLKRYSLPLSGALLIALLSSLLYVPFLSNSLVFDDHNFFTNLSIYDFAVKPFDLRPRHFPSFTLGFVQVMGGTIETHRIVSLVLHVLCAWMLFFLLSALLKQALKTSVSALSDETQRARQATVAAGVGAIWFAIHPIAVYGAGYLAQRTILFATLFSLMSLWFYRRAFAENRTADVITAALFYSAAVFSKEHAVMLPLAALALTILYDGDWRTRLKRAGIYLVLCLPAAFAAVTANKGVVATSYEPYVGEITSQISDIPLMNHKPWGQWVVSVAIQAKTFFDYVYYWFIPDVRALSADIRLNFVETWNGGWVFVKVALFAGWAGGGLYLLLRRRGAAVLFGAGMLYCWMLYATEFATVRFQEPFVLYRSYLWAPGLAMMLVALLSRVPLRATAIGFALLAPLLFFLAHNRLQSFATERAVWEDAAAKLAAPDLPGADRIYYNRGGERFKKGELLLALEDLNKVVELNPGAFQGYLGRGKIYLRMKKYPEALVELDRSLSLRPPRRGLYGLVQFHRATVLQELGRKKEAWEAYQASADDGFYFAKLIVEQAGHDKQGK